LSSPQAGSTVYNQSTRAQMTKVDLQTDANFTPFSNFNVKYTWCMCETCGGQASTWIVNTSEED